MAKFKVGDLVVCAESHTGFNAAMEEWVGIPLQVYKVTENRTLVGPPGDTKPKHKIHGGNCYSFHPSWLTLATSERPVAQPSCTCDLHYLINRGCPSTHGKACAQGKWCA